MAEPFRPTKPESADGRLKCADCGKEFEAVVKVRSVSNCCDACHARRIQSVARSAEAGFEALGWQPPENKSRVRSRAFWVVTVVVCFIAAAVFFSMPRAKRRYERWSAARSVQRAADFYARGDFTHAALDARSALEINPRDVEAARIMARSLEAMGAPSAIQWRRQLDSLSPGDAENTLAWAKDALAAGDAATAEQVLGNLKPGDRNSAIYHDVMAGLALRKRDAAGAEAHWTEAAKLDPKEEKYRSNLATLRLGSRSPEARAVALGILNELSAKSDRRLLALRTLLGDATSHGDWARAKELATTLASDPQATFADKLTRLATLRTLKDREATAFLLQLKQGAMSKPEELFQLLAWMNQHDLALMVIEWMPDLPPIVIEKPPVCVAVADACARGLDWERLNETLEGASWGELEDLRGAYLARALDHLDDAEGAANAWKASLAAAEKNVKRLERLLKMAIEWRWERRAEEALWKLTATEQCPRWVLDTLFTVAERRGATAQLLAISRQLVKADPKSLAVRNDFAFLSLLMRSKEGGGNELAASLYKEAPANAHVASTYGLSLFQQGRVEEAIAVMRTFKPEQLREPGIALYHGIFLLAAKQAVEAKPWLDIGAKRQMLPEEKALLDQVTAAYQIEIFPFQKPAAPPKETWLNSPELLKQLPK